MALSEQIATQMLAPGAIAVVYSESSTVSMLSVEADSPPGSVQLVGPDAGWGSNCLKVPPYEPNPNWPTKFVQSEGSIPRSSTTAMVIPAPVSPPAYSGAVL